MSISHTNSLSQKRKLCLYMVVLKLSKKKCNGLILSPSFVSSGSFVLGLFLCFLTGLVSVLRVGTCGLNDSADLKCHTLSPLPAHSLSLSLSSDMQPARRSSRLSKLKNVESDPPCVSETAPMNTSDIPLGSCPSSRKRVRRRVSDGDTAPPPEHIEPEAESLFDEESSDDNPD